MYISWKPAKCMTLVRMPTTALAPAALAWLTSRSSAWCRVSLKTSLNSLISPRTSVFRRTGDAAHRAHRIGDVAEHEFARLIARIHVAIQLLGVARAGEGCCAPGAPLTPEPTNRNSELPPRLRSSEVTPTTPCTPSRLASARMRSNAASRPAWIIAGHVRNLAADDRREKPNAPRRESPSTGCCCRCTTPLGVSPLSRMQ